MAHKMKQELIRKIVNWIFKMSIISLISNKTMAYA